jgi:glyoxylase-like metal-dependent hydrolase (beta-lactamase superfamily II)
MRFGRISVILSKDYSSNTYIIDDEKLCVIDPGFGRVDYGIEPKDVDIVINTHAHYDHVGNNYLFENADFFIHEKDLVLLQNSGGGAGAFFGETYKAVPLKPIAERIDLGETVFEVIHTPGHTPGGICLLEKNLKVLVSGDTVFADGIGRTDFEGGSTMELKESLQRISKIDFEHLLPGHGPLGNKESVLRGLSFINVYG